MGLALCSALHPGLRALKQFSRAVSQQHSRMELLQDMGPGSADPAMGLGLLTPHFSISCCSGAGRKGTEAVPR